jgi:hypothetical protein
LTVTIDTGERISGDKRVHFVEIWIASRRFVTEDMATRGEALRAAAETGRALGFDTGRRY